MYVDGFVLPVPKGNVAAYRRLSRKCGKIWKEYGALRLGAMMDPKDMPFDSKRMFWGGFKSILEL